MQLACYSLVIYQESTSDSEAQKFTRLKHAVKWESLKVGKSAVEKFATQTTLISDVPNFPPTKISQFETLYICIRSVESLHNSTQVCHSQPQDCTVQNWTVQNCCRRTVAKRRGDIRLNVMCCGSHYLWRRACMHLICDVHTFHIKRVFVDSISWLTIIPYSLNIHTFIQQEPPKKEAYRRTVHRHVS